MASCIYLVLPKTIYASEVENYLLKMRYWCHEKSDDPKMQAESLKAGRELAQKYIDAIYQRMIQAQKLSKADDKISLNNKPADIIPFIDEKLICNYMIWMPELSS
jgi:hypothetical protein